MRESVLAGFGGGGHGICDLDSVLREYKKGTVVVEDPGHEG